MPDSAPTRDTPSPNSSSPHSSSAGATSPSESSPTTLSPGRTFFRAIELSGAGVHPAAWRRADSRAEELFTAGYWLDAITAAERAGLDAVLVPDSFEAGSGGPGTVRGKLDAVAITARAAARTTRIGLIPRVATTHTEPFHVSKAIQALDFATLGRAGWEVTVSEGAAQAKAFGRKGAQDPVSLWQEADEAIEVVTRLWDSWEDDAEIRDLSTGRFVDRDKLHYIDFVGEHFSVKGPSITPRSPQGRPIVVIRADEGPAIAVATRRADLIRIAPPDLDSAHARRTALRTAALAAGRDPDTLTVLLDIDIHLAGSDAAAHTEVEQLDHWSDPPHAGKSAAPRLRHLGTVASLNELLTTLAESGAADGVVLRPLAVPAATHLLAETAGTASSVDTWRGSGRAPGTLRDRLGLSRPAGRYVAITEGVRS